MSDCVLEIRHIPSETDGDGLLRVREGEFRAVLGSPRLCAQLSEGLGGLSCAGEMEMSLEGKAFCPRSPRAALKKGVAVVTPDCALAPGLSLIKHIRLLPGVRGGRKKAEALCDACGFEMDLTVPAGELSVGDRYRGGILLALLRDCALLVLCRPEAALTALEAEAVAAGLRKACQQEKTVLLLTCRPGVAALADAEDALCLAPDDTPPDRLDINVGSVVLEARGLTGGGLADVSFEARAGEILAIAGLPGSGKQALLDAVTGTLPLRAGRLRLNGREINDYDVRERVRAGVACVPGADGNFGFPLERVSLGESMALRRYREPAFQESGFLRKGEMNRYAGDVLAWLKLQPGEEEAAENRRRCALTRETDGNIHALLTLNPTVGLAEDAARDVWDRLIILRDERRAVVVLTSDVREALLLGDRVLALCEGEITGAFDPAVTTEKELGLYLTGRRQGGEERFDEE